MHHFGERAPRRAAGGILLLMIMPVLAGCLESDTQYQRPRSMDTPGIYANSPTPVGRLKDN
jgi:hypothetical protein